jgi:hypothetical protein
MPKKDDGKAKQQKPKPQVATKQPVDKAALLDKIRASFQSAFGHEDVGLKQFWGK